MRQIENIIFNNGHALNPFSSDLFSSLFKNNKKSKVLNSYFNDGFFSTTIEH